MFKDERVARSQQHRVVSEDQHLGAELRPTLWLTTVRDESGPPAIEEEKSAPESRSSDDVAAYLMTIEIVRTRL